MDDLQDEIAAACATAASDRMRLIRACELAGVAVTGAAIEEAARQAAETAALIVVADWIARGRLTIAALIGTTSTPSAEPL